MQAQISVEESLFPVCYMMPTYTYSDKMHVQNAYVAFKI